MRPVRLTNVSFAVTEVKVLNVASVLYCNTQEVAAPLSVQLSVAMLPFPGVRVAVRLMGAVQGAPVPKIMLSTKKASPVGFTLLSLVYFHTKVWVPAVTLKM